MTSRYASLTRAELATLVPELLLIGQLIDRSGMAWCIQAFGREEMAQVAIEEWAGASPIYTRRMQKALGYEGTDVITIFKGLQLDIGAPPQFMDFRYTVEDRWTGAFHLDHCGALMDVEPMGEDYVRSMCHDIEDPTFDATAVATNAKAQVRPLHRPPRVDATSKPHCSWTVRIDESHPPVEPLPAYHFVAATQAATIELDPIDPSDEGQSDYSGDLVGDLDFTVFSHSALVRMADEICVQMQLLNLSFGHAVSQRADEEQERAICLKQLIGIAGIAGERIHRALGLPSDEAGALRLLELHPIFNPDAYVRSDFAQDGFSVSAGPADQDGGWIALCGPDELRPLQAVVRAVDAHLDVEPTDLPTDLAADLAAGWGARVVRREVAAREPDEVAVTRFSTGASFEFEPRLSLSITPI